jgi:hypothetical protein
VDRARSTSFSLRIYAGSWNRHPLRDFDRREAPRSVMPMRGTPGGRSRTTATMTARSRCWRCAWGPTVEAPRSRTSASASRCSAEEQSINWLEPTCRINESGYLAAPPGDLSIALEWRGQGRHAGRDLRLSGARGRHLAHLLHPDGRLGQQSRQGRPQPQVGTRRSTRYHGRGTLPAKARIQVSSFRALSSQDSSCKEARGQR